MQAVRKIATITTLPTAAKQPVPQPPLPRAPKGKAWGGKLARTMAESLPEHQPWLVGTTIDPETFDDLTFIAIPDWAGDGRSQWDASFRACDRLLRSRGLHLVGCGQARAEVLPGPALKTVFLYRGGDVHDRAMAADFLARARAATSKGRPFLRIVR